MDPSTKGSQGNKKSGTVADKGGKTKKTPDADKLPTPKEYTAEELGAVGADSGKWDKEFLGKMLRVSGEVELVSAPLAYLKTSKQFETGQPVKVTLTFADGEAARKLTRGDKVLVEGKARSAGIFGPYLENVTLVKTLAAAPKADGGMSAIDFAKEVYADPKAGLEKYQGKRIQLTGQVGEASPEYSFGGMSLKTGLKHRKMSFLVVGLRIYVQPEKILHAYLLGVGQKVQVTGELTGITDDAITLRNCTFAELEKNPMPSLAATELAAAYVKDVKEASRKYGGEFGMRKDLFVQGKVAEIADAEFGNKAVHLEGSGKTNVVCYIRAKDAKDLKKGDEIRVKAQCVGLVNSAGQANVHCPGWLVPKELWAK